MSGILGRLLGNAAAAAASSFFNLVTLLLNTTSTNGAQNNTFLDSSSSPITLTTNGTPAQGTFTPFSQTGWSNYLQGSDSGFSFTGINIGTSQFTFEGWIYVPSFSTIQHMYGSAAANDISVEINNATTIVIDKSGVGSQSFTVASMSTNAWHHIAVVRNASVMTVFVDGVRSSTGTLANTVTYNNFAYIGYKSSGFPLIGYASNFRVVKSAVYDPTQTTLTVPTTPLTNIANTVLLTCQSNRFVDNSSSAVTLTPTNSPTVQAFSPFLPTTSYDAAVVGGSGYFVSATDYLALTGNSVNVGSSDFSFEAWIYVVSRTTNYVFGGQSDRASYTGSSYNFQLTGTNGYLATELYIGNGNSNFASTTAPPLNAWSHVVFARTGGTASMFLNGIQVATNTGLGTSAINNGSTTYLPAIGSNATGNANTFDGYISNLRFIIGSGGYNATSSTITVPTALVTNSANTKLLANFTNAGIYDAAAKNNLRTVGNAQVSTTQAKFGTTSMGFDGTGDNLKVKLTNAIGSGDYTIEGFFYASGTGIQYLFDIRETSQYIGSYIIGSSTTLYVNFGTTLDITASTSFALNTWNHMAFVRSGSGSNNTSVYLNGSRVYQRTDTTNYSIVPNLFVACENSGNYYLNGYVDEFRITKGYAVYSGATYTVPTAAFPTL